MTLRRLSLLLAISVLAVIVAGCDLLGTGDSDTTQLVTSGVYVANAGAFGNANSSYTVYDPTTDETQRIPSNRTGFSSYIQSLNVHEDRVYLLFGETNSIGIFDADTNERIGQISGIRNPRYMDANQEIAYVTGQDYSPPISPKLYKVNLSSQTIVDSAVVGRSAEDVLTTGENIFVAQGGRDGSVTVFNPGDLAAQDTISTQCDNPHSLVRDQQDDLLVFCAGATVRDANFNVIERTDGAIRVVDPDTRSVTQQIPLDTMLTSVSQGQRVSYSPRADEAFAVLADQTILRFDASENAVADQFEAPGNPIGAIGYDAVANRLYVGRAASDPFGASGKITVHRPNGEQVNSFDAGGSGRPGIAPTHIDFRQTVD